MSWAAVIGAGATLASGFLFGGKGDDQVNKATDTAGLLGDIAMQQWDWYKEQYRPLESAILDEARTAGSAAEYERRSEQAAGDVGLAFGQARERRARDLASYGLNPEDGRFQAGLDTIDLNQAAASAGAQNRARTQVRNEAWLKRIQAMGLGQNLVGQALNGLGASTGALANIGRYENSRSDNTASGIGAIIGDLAGSFLKKQPGGNYGTIDPTTAGPGLPW